MSGDETNCWLKKENKVSFSEKAIKRFSQKYKESIKSKLSLHEVTKFNVTLSNTLGSVQSVFVCVCQKEKERKKERKRERERERG